MKLFRRFLLLTLCLTLAASGALAAKATPTPAPREITEDVIQEVPETIQTMLDLAYSELMEVDGKELKTKNKYTKWRNNYDYGWCGGFVTWCMLEVGIPQQTWNKTPKNEVSGLVHVKEAGVGKMVTGYTRMSRTTRIPQKGFVVVYGNTNKKFAGMTPLYHVGLVYDVEKLTNGKYRLTTIEGNVSMKFKDAEGTLHKATHTVRMYTRDYDPAAEDEKKDLTLVPEEEQTREETNTFTYKYTYDNDSLYVHLFLMPWIPGEDVSA